MYICALCNWIKVNKFLVCHADESNTNDKKNSIENKENKKQKNRRLHTYWLKLFKCGLPFQTLKSSIFFFWSFLFAQHSVLFICYTLHTEKSFCVLCLFPVSLGIRIITFNAQGNNDAAKKIIFNPVFSLSFFFLSFIKHEWNWEQN